MASSGNMCMTSRKASKPSPGNASDHLQLATKSSMLLLYHIILFCTTTQKWQVVGQHPVGLALDQQDNLFVVDQGNDRIQKLTPAGKSVAQWGTTGAGPGQFLQPGSIAIDSKGNIYVTDGSTRLVQQFSSSGKLLAAWGAGGTSALQFGIPRGVAVDDEGNIYVASVDLNGETFVNGRITKLSSSGELLAMWK